MDKHEIELFGLGFGYGFIFVITIAFIIAILSSCAATHESTNIVEPSDSTNYNATYILP